MSAEISVRDAFVQFGADLIGFAPPTLPQSYTDGYASWLGAGMHADMDYLAKRPATGIDCNDLLPGTQTVIVLAFNYKPSALADTSRPAPTGRIARYATIRDYHKTVGSILKQAGTYLKDEFGAASRGFVDASPLMERAYAEQSGLGFVGKSGMLITETYGTFVFLSTLLTTLKLETAAPTIIRDCGTCNACLKACPSGAILGDGYVDSRKCLSYLTIEHRNTIDPQHWPAIGPLAFGCDACLTACPHHNAPPGDPELRAAKPAAKLSLAEILQWADADWDLATRGKALRRASYAMFLRNAILAAGNSNNPALRPLLLALQKNPDHAHLKNELQWAIQHLPTPKNP